MFYAQFVLAKKGPLSKIWLAAHWEKKLTKAQIFETDVERAVEEVIKPKVKMALRTVGHLLLGIVRIYSKKTRYLLADTNEAFIKMRLNFRNGIQLDLENFEVLGNADSEEMDACDEINMTIPEFMDFELDERLLQANLSRLEDITMKDDHDLNAQFEKLNAAEKFKNFAKEYEDFGEFDVYGSYHTSSVPTPVPEPFEQVRDSSSHMIVDDFPVNNTIIDMSSEMPLNVKSHPADKSRTMMEEAQNVPMVDDLFSSMIDVAPQAAPGEEFEYMDVDNFEAANENPHLAEQDNRRSFALDPLNTSHIEEKKGKKTRRNRKLIVDEVTNIDNNGLKEQLENFNDLIGTLAVAPPSKKMMRMRTTGDLQYLMETPGMNMYNGELLQNYRSFLVPCAHKPATQFEDESTSTDRQSQPWDDLELNDNIVEDKALDFENDERPDSRFNDFDDVPPTGDDLNPQNKTLEVSMGNYNGILPMNYDDVGGFGFGHNENNKENQEEGYPDQFSVSSSLSSKGKLEAYGFGSAAKQAIYNDSKWAKRTKQILKKISNELDDGQTVNFSSIVSSAKNRKQAAEQFYSLLSLAKSQAVTVKQAEPFGEIVISSGDCFVSAIESANNSVLDVSRPLTRTPLRAL